MSRIVSVGNLVKYLKNRLDGDENLRGLLIKGEVSNVKARSANGHVYFTLKDENGGISCVMFASNAAKCKIQLKDGLKVLVKGSISLYPATGNNQIYVESIELDGIGELYLKIEALKKKLLAEGLFDDTHKKPLPKYPRRIGVISTMEGAGTQDVFTTLKRRWPIAQIVFYPSLVQGVYAAKNLIKRLDEADNDGNDVILLVRGGGSLEDLLCFYDEELIRFVYAMETPIISGVGHETDTTLVDYVSDKRANTPTGAAEIATPDYHEVLLSVETLETRLIRDVKVIVQDKTKSLERLKKHPYIQNPKLKVIHKNQDLALMSNRLMHYPDLYEHKKHDYINLKQRLMNKSTIIVNEKHRLENNQNDLKRVIKNYYDQKNNQLKHDIALLDAYSPLKTLAKGYAISYSGEKLIKSVNDVEKNDEISVVYRDGRLLATVADKEVK